MLNVLWLSVVVVEKLVVCWNGGSGWCLSVLSVIVSVILWLILCRVSWLMMLVWVVLIGLICVDMKWVLGKCLVLSRLCVSVVLFYLLLFRFRCCSGMLMLSVVLV